MEERIEREKKKKKYISIGERERERQRQRQKREEKEKEIETEKVSEIHLFSLLAGYSPLLLDQLQNFICNLDNGYGLGGYEYSFFYLTVRGEN